MTPEILRDGQAYFSADNGWLRHATLRRATCAKQ
jgi:hypothetical protein